jgi:ATP-dependent Clp protease, protease subunit
MNDVTKQDQPEQFIPYEMVSLASMGTHLLFGEIDEGASYRACEFIIKSNLMLEDATALTLLINSPGGSVSDGFAIIDTMTTSRIKIQTVGVGMIASMGVLISSAGTKGLRVITKNTEVMAHQFSSMLLGKYHDLVASQKFHTRLQQQFINHFKKHSTMTDKQIKDILFSPSDRWLTAQECKKFGLCDIVTEYFSPGAAR